MRVLSALAGCVGGLSAYHYLVQDLRATAPFHALTERALALLRAVVTDAEAAHHLGVAAAAAGLCPVDGGLDDPDRAVALRCEVFGLPFRSPVGLAAGFDKQGEAMAPLLRAGFGFVEVGTVTPLPQPGNPQPRMFRLEEDAAVINRYGFNSDGADAVAARLRVFWLQLARATGAVPGAPARPPPRGLVGVNIGKNKEGDAVADYASGTRRFAPFADYITVNVSSPNTPGLRALQGRAQLAALLRAVQAARAEVPWGAPEPAPGATEGMSLEGRAAAPLVARRPPPGPPILVKVSPDMTPEDLADVAAVVLELRVDGVIVSNTTVARPPTLRGAAAGEAGGLSGAPLFEPSTRVLAQLHQLTGGRVPLIGAGGVASAEQAYAKIRAGASLVQLYSALAYQSKCARRGRPRAPDANEHPPHTHPAPLRRSHPCAPHQRRPSAAAEERWLHPCFAGGGP